RMAASSWASTRAIPVAVSRVRGTWARGSDAFNPAVDRPNHAANHTKMRDVTSRSSTMPRAPARTIPKTDEHHRSTWSPQWTDPERPLARVSAGQRSFDVAHRRLQHTNRYTTVVTCGFLLPLARERRAPTHFEPESRD